MRLLLIAIITIGGYGCAGTWDAKGHKALRVVVELADVTHAVGAEAIQAECVKRARACKAAGDKVCGPAERCLKKRQTFDASVKALMRASKLASDSLAAIAETLREFGVKP